VPDLWEGKKIIAIYALRDRKLEIQVQTNYLHVNKRIIFNGIFKK
jgi:hypothetical protein